MATNHPTTTPISFQTQNRLDCLNAGERVHLEGLLDRKEVSEISISDDDNKALIEIAGILKRWPEGFSVKREELLAIAADADIDEKENVDLSDLWGDIPGWFPAFLPSLNAWRDVSQAILDLKQLPELGLGPEPMSSEISGSFNGWFDELNRLMAEVLEAYAPADRELFHLCASDINEITESEKPPAAARELLKRYSHYRGFVCDFAKEVWPRVNLNKLLEQV